MVEKLSKAEELIVDVLKKNGKPVSTYEIAKQAGISWATVNVHCLKLKYQRVIDNSMQESKIGAKKMLWWLRK